MSALNRSSKSLPSILLVLVILILGGGVTAYLMMTAPTTEPTEKPKAVKIVQVMEATGATETIHVTAEGVVLPIREVTIKPEVRGRILAHHPALILGGRLREDEELVRIDPADYELALTEHQAALEEAEFAIEVEQGRQVIAQREFALLEKDLQADDVNQALVLRQPHLERAEALLAKAKNEIAKAELALTRTTIRAPFNAVVIEESVEKGQLIDSSDTICKLAGTDAFWVQVTVPFEDLKWIQFPGQDRSGSQATVIHDRGGESLAEWPGVVDQLLTDLQPNTRKARVLIRVDDPLGLYGSDEASASPLFLGNFVRVRIEAGTLDNVIDIPREALRGDDELWVVDQAETLQIRQTKVLWKRKDSLLVENVLQAGERVIVSDLRAALPGMQVSAQPRATSP